MKQEATVLAPAKEEKEFQLVEGVFLDVRKITKAAAET